MAYTTEAKVEAYIGSDISTTFFTTALAWVKQWIDTYCGKTFEAASETRYYDTKGGSCILIDSFTSITSIEILDSTGASVETLATGDYNLYPLNSTEKNEIRLINRSFRSGSKTLKVVGVFGASLTVPADIEMVATKLVGEVAKGNDHGAVTAETLGDYSVSYAAVEEKAKALGVYQTLDMHRDIDI